MSAIIQEPTTIRYGVCLCRTVRYELKGEPFMFLVCHCTNCKKSSGSAFMANTLFNSDQFSIIEGEDTIRGYDDTADSGETITRHFCSNCGSSLFNTNKKNPRFAGLVVVATGTIEDDFDWVPKKEVFCERRRKFLSEIAVPRAARGDENKKFA